MTIFIPLVAGAAGLVGGGAAIAAAYSRRIARQVERNIPPDGSFHTIRGRRLHVRDIGQGPAIVMIHGLAGQMRNFAAVVPLLAAGHRLVLIDRPGSGHSPGRGDDSLTDQAAIVAELIDRLGLDRPLIVGHSLGGAVSMALALDHPGKIAGLALIAPLTQVQEEVPAAFRGLVIEKPAVRAIIANTLAIPMMRLNSDKSRITLFAPEPVHPAFDIDYGGAMLARPRAFFASSSELVAVNGALAPLVARYGEIALPVRILFGEGDQVLPAAVHGTRTAGEVRGAQCTILPDAGHMLPVTIPARVAAFVAEARAAV
ncbi:alpha/beta fold hydrolase [Sphingomonas koreensis]|jgi:pimeloyl-ACP methyl ester carboxylesterase|uniref:Alpha/beta fold hydrolase n=1 Tax=Sphingomonas koreensis TaxID=93064 RepID=A0A430FXJ6_9SPHN|nr:alpha/beta fold hydrolase [Sphingomonas koreensis]RSY76309.1 alpha/beta fold hydrolase [Sphingomonas koreensis]